MKKYTNTGSKDTRSGFGAGMTELGQKNENVVALCADLIGSLKMGDFQKEFPDSDYSEEIAYLKVIAQFDLAESTIESKQRERYGDAAKFYLELIDKYPSSAYLKLSEKMYDRSLKEVARLTALEAEQKALLEKERSNTSKVTTSPQ